MAKKMKNILLVALSLVLIVSLTIAGTVAYLTHEDEEVNTFTVGDVEVRLVEKERNDQQKPTKLVDFKQGKPLLPVVGSIGDKDTEYGIPNPANYQDKIVYAQNVGDSAAYMRIRIAVPTYENTSDTPRDSSKNNLHWNYVGDATRNKIMEKVGMDNFAVTGVTGPVRADEVIYIDGQSYNVYTFTYDAAIPAGKYTGIVMCGLYLDEKVDYNPDSGMYEDVNGEEFYIPNRIVNIPVIVEGVQVEGFATVDDAFAAANFPANPWEPAEVVTVDTKEAFSAALENIDGDTIIDLENCTETVNMNAALKKDKVPAGTTVTIKNAKVDGRSYGNKIDGTVVFENCTFTNTGAYAIHFDGGNGNVIFRNCELNGWCSFGSLSSVELYDCTVQGNGEYAMIRFYQKAIMQDCTIDCTNTNTTDEYADGVSIVRGETVAISNCTITGADFETAEGGRITVDGEIVAEGDQLVEN